MAATFATIATAELIAQGMTENNANAQKVIAWLNEQQAKQRAIFFGYNADPRIVAFLELTGGYFGLPAARVSTPYEIVPLAKIAAWRYMYDHLADTTPAPNGAVRKDAPNSTPQTGWVRRSELAAKIAQAYRTLMELCISVGQSTVQAYATIAADAMTFATGVPLEVGDTITIGAETIAITAETTQGTAYTLASEPVLQGEQPILFTANIRTHRLPAIGIWHAMEWGGAAGSAPY